MKTRKQTFGWLAIVAALALVAGGCGSDSDDSSSDSSSTKTTTTATTETADTASADTDAAAAGATELALGIKPGKLRFDKDELTAPAGKVTITFTNAENIQHNVALKDSDGEVLEEGELVGDGGVSTITLDDLKPGTYEFYCTPHESVGMKGTLTIT